MKFEENSFPYSRLVSTSSSQSSSCSSSFSIPLTVFDDIVVQVSLPSFSNNSSSSSLPSCPSSHNSSLQDLSVSHSVSDSIQPTHSSSTPITQVPPSHSMQTRSKAGIFKPKHLISLFTSVSPSISEPKHFHEAIRHSVWQKAMAEEYEALVKQGTWVLVPPPSHGNVIGCQWIYKVKRHSDGSIARYKARLVASGNQQAEGVDFLKTFSHVVKQPIVRIILGLAVHYQWPLKQLDVSNAFLHGTLTEDVFMRQPQGYTDPNHPTYVCKLTKALYGLKQAPRARFSVFSSYLLELGFQASKADTSLFILHKANSITLILVYVDDIILTGNDSTFLSQLVELLSAKFVLKDLGSLRYFLGIEVTYSQSGMFISQTKYALELLTKAGMDDCKPNASPTSTKGPYDPSDLPFDNIPLFRTLVGSLQYLTLTRPDIAFAVNIVSQHMHQPKVSHFMAVKRLLRYIKGTLHHGLHITAGPLFLTAYADADWAGDPVDRHSTSGFVVFLGATPVSWSAKKQHGGRVSGNGPNSSRFSVDTAIVDRVACSYFSSTCSLV